MNTNLLQMYYYVYLSVWGRNTDCIHSMAELQVWLWEKFPTSAHVEPTNGISVLEWD